MRPNDQMSLGRAIDERTYLIQKKQPAMQQLGTGSKKHSPLLPLPPATNHLAPLWGNSSQLPPSVHSINAINPEDHLDASAFAGRKPSVDRHLETSVGGMSSIMAYEAGSKDLQDLLDSLEKTTSLLRAHMQGQEPLREET